MENGEAKIVGGLLREWRVRRRLSQLSLALEAEVSSKHLSFLETGRAQPSREMILHLAQHLEVPLRERNVLLTAAGFAPFFPERPLDDQSLLAAHRAVELILAGHEPHPALAIDRHWTLIAANKAIEPLLSKASASLLQPPVNVLRLSLHPQGLAPQIVNYAEWRAHALERLQHEIDITADALLMELLQELKKYPAPAHVPSRHREDKTSSHIAVPFQLLTEAGELSFLSTTTVFGTAVEVNLAELAIESFFPADAQTSQIMQRLHNSRNS
jgi:transcriptional regulator with XRE-family HTH domain